jgi:uncharacterized lipoprotein YajG
MKTLVIAAALAVLAGCADLPDSIRHPLAASGSTAQSATAADNFEYPYDAPYP